MKRLLAYLFLVLGLGFATEANSQNIFGICLNTYTSSYGNFIYHKIYKAKSLSKLKKK